VQDDKRGKPIREAFSERSSSRRSRYARHCEITFSAHRPRELRDSAPAVRRAPEATGSDLQKERAAVSESSGSSNGQRKVSARPDDREPIEERPRETGGEREREREKDRNVRIDGQAARLIRSRAKLLSDERKKENGSCGQFRGLIIASGSALLVVGNFENLKTREPPRTRGATLIYHSGDARERASERTSGVIN